MKCFPTYNNQLSSFRQPDMTVLAKWHAPQLAVIITEMDASSPPLCKETLSPKTSQL